MDWSMIGHEWAVNLLSEHVRLGRERHAYLLTGPSGIGRRTLALRFAQSLNCNNSPEPGQPCRTCSTCKRIEQMQHPDLAMVMAEREGERLKIDQVRELQHNLSLAPYEARYRVVLILRFEEAQSSSANAMLKTLEEPPDHVVVILTANSAENLLPTIVSRCEVLRLRSLSMDETAKGLQAIRGVPKEISERLAHISDGRPGYAIRLFEQPRLLEQRISWLDELIQLLAASRRERFAFIKVFVDDKEGLRDALQVWLTFWRDVLISTCGMSNLITNLDYTSQIQKLVSVIDLQKAHFHVNAIERTIETIDHNVNARLALEVLLMDFPIVNLVL
jgi:DNA polymerase III subunit delta'